MTLVAPLTCSSMHQRFRDPASAHCNETDNTLCRKWLKESRKWLKVCVSATLLET